MTEALFFHRTPASTKVITPDPHNLPAAQRLNFTLPDNIWQAVEESFQLNNKKFPIPTTFGAIKKMGFSPVGMKGYSRKIRGYFKDPATASIAKLRTFRKLQQVDSFHEFGVFGVEFSPEAPEFDIDGDPVATFGWSFDAYTLKNLSSLSNKVYDFSIDISWAGTLA